MKRKQRMCLQPENTCRHRMSLVAGGLDLCVLEGSCPYQSACPLGKAELLDVLTGLPPEEISSVSLV